MTTTKKILCLLLFSCDFMLIRPNLWRGGCSKSPISSSVIGMAKATSAANKQQYMLKQCVTNAEVIKKSKFIAHGSYIKDERAAFDFIEKVSDPKATHNCWAFKTDSSSYRTNDDNEPSGTAGKPILSAIESMQLIHTVVVVSRYYGGIKLGTGGLTRAYRSVAENALLRSDLTIYVATCSINITVPSADAGFVYNYLDRVKQSAIAKTFDVVSMSTSLQVDVKVDDIDAIKEFVMDVTKGKGIVTL